MRKRERRPALDAAQSAAVIREARKAVEDAGFGVVVARAFPEWRLRLMVERSDGASPTVGECERASRLAEGGIRAAGLEPGDFEIEVESPGADRPLTRDGDFERFRDHQITVTLREARDGRRNFTGRLIGRSGGDVTVHVLDEEAPQSFPLAEVREVRLHPEMKLRPAEPERRGRRHGRRR